MSARSVEYVVFVTWRKEKRLKFRMDLFIYEEGLSVKFNFTAEDMVRGTSIWRNVAKKVVFSAWLPFKETIEGAVITEIEIMLEIDGTSVALEAAGRPGNPPMCIDSKLVIFGIGVVRCYTPQRRKAEPACQQESTGHSLLEFHGVPPTAKNVDYS